MKNLSIRLRSLAVLCLSAVFLLAPPSAALALKLTIRNDFAVNLNAAVVYYSDSSGAWTTIGWYVVNPRKSRTINFSTSKSTIYIYSHLSGKRETLSGKGDITRVVMSKAFMYEDGEICPAGPDRRTEKFTKYGAENGLVNYRPMKIGEPFPAGGEYNFSAARAELLKLINAERRKIGAGDLKRDATLTKAAARRASEQPRTWGHIRPDGKNYSSVFAEFNLNPASSGENVASNTKPLKASSFHEQFMDSPGHKKILLNPDYSAVGLAFHKEGDRTYCVELFTGGKGGSGNTQSSAKDSLALTAANVMNLINNERTRSGLAPLGTSDKLSAAALTRAREMNVKFDIATRPDGRKYDTVLRDNGLVFARTMTWGVDTPEANALEIFHEFYKDGKVLNSMLAREYTDLGAGVCRLGKGYYTLLMFAGGGESGTPATGLTGAWKDLERAVQELRDMF